MDQTNKTLTQAEIDAVLSKRPQAQVVPPKAAKTSSPGSIAQEPRKPVTSIEEESLRATVVDLAQRVAQIELDMGNLNQLQRALVDKGSALELNTQDVRSLTKKLQDLSAQVEGLVQSLLATPGYGARKNFKCSHCGSQGTVASVLRCTQCGKDGLLGWWPKK